MTGFPLPADVALASPAGSYGLARSQWFDMILETLIIRTACHQCGKIATWQRGQSPANGWQRGFRSDPIGGGKEKHAR